MVEAEGFVDITQETRLPAEEVNYIMENPEGLTLEGVKYCQKLWKFSGNKYQKEKFKRMLTMCKKLEPSAKLGDGRTVLSRKKDNHDNMIVWAENI
jgi:hypothetical protein